MVHKVNDTTLEHLHNCLLNKPSTAPAINDDQETTSVVFQPPAYKDLSHILRIIKANTTNITPNHDKYQTSSLSFMVIDGIDSEIIHAQAKPPSRIFFPTNKDASDRQIKGGRLFETNESGNPQVSPEELSQILPTSSFDTPQMKDRRLINKARQRVNAD